MNLRTRLSRYFLPGALHIQEYSAIALWLIRLRWVAVCGFFLLAAGLYVFAPVFLPNRLFISVCFIIFLYNLAFFILSRTQKDPRPRFSHILVRLPVCLDWIALLVLIDLTGGIFSPLVFFFVLHIIINSMIFPLRQCYLFTTVSLLGMGVLFLVEHSLLAYQTNTSWLGIRYEQLNLTTIVFAFAVYAVILYAATFLATSIMSRFKQRENDVRLLSRRLQESLTRMEILYEATKTMVSSNDINTILEILVRESTRIMNVKGAVLRLVQEGQAELTAFASYGLSESFCSKGPVRRGEGIFPKSPEEVVMVENAQTDPRIVYPQEAVEEGIRSIVSIPLVQKGVVKGDLRLYSGQRRTFSSDEISFLKVLSGGAAVILDDVRAWHALEEANKRIVLFAKKMSHDLRGPVVAVQSFLSAMLEGYMGEMTPRQREVLERCLAKHEQLIQLIRDILNLAEEQAAPHEEKLVDICMDETAAEALKMFEVLFRKKNITVVHTPPPGRVPFREVSGDFQRLFFNLLENALRYTPEGGRVEFSMTGSSDSVSILVRDTGIGIEPDQLERIFDEFHRAPQAKKFVQDGTGLGLSIVRSIIKRYNGFISIESAPGQGTTFHITIPLVPAQ